MSLHRSRFLIIYAVVLTLAALAFLIAELASPRVQAVVVVLALLTMAWGSR